MTNDKNTCRAAKVCNIPLKRNRCWIKHQTDNMLNSTGGGRVITPLLNVDIFSAGSSIIFEKRPSSISNIIHVFIFKMQFVGPPRLLFVDLSSSDVISKHL